jgi:hypothetical protein
MRFNLPAKSPFALPFLILAAPNDNRNDSFQSLHPNDRPHIPSCHSFAYVAETELHNDNLVCQQLLLHKVRMWCFCYIDRLVRVRQVFASLSLFL